jgi:hypothetical protein
VGQATNLVRRINKKANTGTSRQVTKRMTAGRIDRGCTPRILQKKVSL